MIRLLIGNWFEPPRGEGLHASTLVQQILSVIAQQGGASAAQLWGGLIETGTFKNVSKADFFALLKGLGEKKLIVQDSSGLMLPGEIGERLINHYEFYSAFTSDEEFRLVREGKPLGSIPVSRPLMKGQRIIFGGRRWRVLEVDIEKKVIVVTAARGGQPPQFDGLGAMVHDHVREEMRAVLTETTPCPFIDSKAQELLSEARKSFRSLGLVDQFTYGSDTRTHLLTWRGDQTNDALVLMFNHVGLACESSGLALTLSGSQKDVADALAKIAALDPDDVEGLLDGVENLIKGKWDWALPRSLLMKSYASSQLNLKGARDFAKLLTVRPLHGGNAFESKTVH
jgi:ATP-dependent Lhr-like helicase